MEGPQESDSYEEVATEPDGLDVEENDDVDLMGSLVTLKVVLMRS